MVTDDFGDPDIDLEAATADADLRDLLSEVPASSENPDRGALIEVVIAAAWPGGTPPTAEELALDPDFDAVIGIAVDVDDVAEVDGPDVGDGEADDVLGDADPWTQDPGWDAPDGSDDQG